MLHLVQEVQETMLLIVIHDNVAVKFENFVAFKVTWEHYFAKGHKYQLFSLGCETPRYGS